MEREKRTNNIEISGIWDTTTTRQRSTFEMKFYGYRYSYCRQIYSAVMEILWPTNHDASPQIQIVIPPFCAYRTEFTYEGENTEFSG